MKLILKAKRPVLYVGGGVIKADASKELFELADHRQPAGRDHADGARRVPRLARAAAWACPACTATTPRSPRCRRPTCWSRSGARFDDRVTGKLAGFAPHAKVDPRRHRPRRDRQEPRGRRADRGRLPRRDRQARTPSWPSARTSGDGAARPFGLARPAARVAGGVPVPVRPAARRPAEAAVLRRASARVRRRRHDRGARRGPASDVRLAVLAVRAAAPLDQLRRPGHDGLRGAGGHGRQGGPARTSASSRSTATAASR